jgi:pimeloyl-ACP methyl ester carboxylesterase
MPSFASYDGTEIGYRVLGDGRPLVCLPGGPGRAAVYLGDLGGLPNSRQLVLADLRGVGMSADPADPATFRVDRLVNDVESLRNHLGLDPMVPPALVRQAAPLFNDATVVVQRGAGHFPWVEDPAAFAAAIGSFLG